MTHADELSLAHQAQKVLAGEPEATVDEIAEAVGSDHETIVRVLDCHVVGDDGKVKRAGPGKGGGWLSG